MGSSISGGDGGPSSSQKRVSLSDSTEIISREGGRFCYPDFSSDDEDDEDDDTEKDDEHESWDESDEELLAMEIRMRGQPRFANFRAATLSPVPFAAGKKWNTVPLRNSPKSEQSPPFPPPRSTSSPYHATNILQRHFANWTKSAGLSSSRHADVDGEGRRGNPDSSKPKRWISFRSFFKRRKDDEDQKEKVEKEKGKLIGIDGTVIHMLPAPPVQQHQWFTEAKPEDPNQKPTIVFTYKPESGPGDGELRIEEVRETALLNPEDSLRSATARRTPSPSSNGGEATRVRADAQTSHSTHFLQLIRRNPEALPGQLRDTVPPTCPGSFLVSTKNITLLILKT
uniref:Uncharacterized protein n=1 Tax=Knipowitschia caucasica TaxID=637954 RepID=A0AAV2KX87_KNICA